MANPPSIDPAVAVGERFARALEAVLGKDFAQADPLIRPAANLRYGDYQANAPMGLAKQVGRNPRDLAQQIVDHLEVGDLCEHASVAGPGFINLRLKADYLRDCLTHLQADGRLGVAPAAQPRTVVVDYSSPNVAKEMHVGHLRSTVIGDALARVLTCLGHQVIRQNHLGDWGTQFGMLIEHLIERGWQGGGGKPISDLNELYQAAKRRFDEDEDFAHRARRRVVALQQGDPPTRRIWLDLVEESKRHFNEVYRRLGVLLADQDIRAESFYNDHLADVVTALDQTGLLRESQGARVVFPEGFAGREGEPVPMIVQKSDGGYLYATTDLAAARFRIVELGARWVIYVTGAPQADHFAMVFWTLRQAGWAGPEVRLDHVAFGSVLGADKKMFRSRTGGTVRLIDLLDEAEQRARKVVEEKNPDLPKLLQERVARAVGIGALKYADLSSARIKDYVFDWDRMLSFEGNTAGYLQNAFVRIRSIFRKGNIDPASTLSHPIEVREMAERQLALKLLQLSAAVQSVAESLEPHRLCNYLYDLATGFHQFYEHCPVLGAEDEAIRNSRLALCELVARTLGFGLELLGIEAVEQM